MMVFWGVIGLLFVAIVMLYISARKREGTPAQRLDAAMHTSGLIVSGTELDESLSQSWFRRLAMPALGRFGGLLNGLAPPRLVEQTRLRMERAGRNPSRAAVPFLALKAFLGLAGLGGIAAIILLHPATWQMRLLACVLVGAVTWLLPDASLNGSIRRRQEQIRKSLPDVIDLLAVSTEAGMGIDGAMSAVMTRKPGPLSDEFGRMMLEVRLGKARDVAWWDLSDRVGLPDLRGFVSALDQAEQLGVSIANTLRAQSDSLRVKHTLYVRQQAATLALKMIFPLTFCILPALFIVVLGPAFLSIQKTLGALH